MSRQQQQPASMATLTVQVDRVRNTLKEYREERDMLMHRLRSIDASLEKTLNEYEQLLREMDVEHARIRDAWLATTRGSFIDGLPNEVLMRIFEIVCEDTNAFNTGDMGSHQQRNSPMDISQVCSRWRIVSLGQSELWKSFGTRIDVGTNVVNQDRRTLFGHYLQRSKDLPMDLWFASSMQRLEGDSTVLHDAISHPHRVRRLAIFFEAKNENANRVVRCIFQSVWPYLESLEIDFHPEAEESLLACTVEGTSVKGFPRLTQYRCQAELFVQIVQCDLSQLTTVQVDPHIWLEYTTYPYRFFLNLVRQPTLLQLSIGNDLFNPPESAQVTPVIAKNLKYFHCSDREVAKRMWTTVLFPKLQHLVLRGIELGSLQFPYNVEEYRTHNQVQPVLAPNLNTLVLYGCTSAYRPPYMHFLGFATAPTTHLVIVDENAMQNINPFEDLVMNSHLTYWPNLETMTFKPEFDEDAVDHPAKLLKFLQTQATKKPFKLRLCREKEVRAKRGSKDRNEWERLEDSGRFEDIDSDAVVIQWPSENFFSNRSRLQLIFDRVAYGI